MTFIHPRARAAAQSPAREISVSLPAPVGGWNARDSLSDMKEDQASRLVNWYPGTSDVAIRPGYVEHATGVGSGTVETVVQYSNATTQQLIAAGGGSVYNATATGAATSLGSGFSENQWQTANYKEVLILVNGTDAPQSYDGSTLGAAGFTGTGLTATDLIGVQPFKTRLFFVETGSASFWYAAVGAITGACTEFQLGQVAQFGGYLMAIGTWSRDAGDGLDDLVVFVMSTGEIIIYSGTDPANDFVKVGSYKASPPIGRRCVAKIGGELVVITATGYLPVSLLLQGGTADTLDAHPIWGSIRSAATEAFTTYGALEGWEIAHGHDEKLFINIPTVAGSTYDQHVLNTETGAWCMFTSIPARAWGIYSGETYFGSIDGKVYRVGGASDGGAAILFQARQAFNYMRRRGQTKRFTAVRPLVQIDGTVDATVAVDVDFSDRALPGNLTNFRDDSVGSDWDEDDWDDGIWAGGSTLVSKWISVQGFGRAAAIRFDGQANAQTVRWVSSELLATVGGVR